MPAVKDTIAFLLANVGNSKDFIYPLDEELMNLVFYNKADHFNANTAARTLRDALKVICEDDAVSPCLLEVLRLCTEALEPYAREMEQLRDGKLAVLLRLAYPQPPEEGFPKAKPRHLKLWEWAQKLRTPATLKELALSKGLVLQTEDTPHGRTYRLVDAGAQHTVKKVPLIDMQVHVWKLREPWETTVYYKLAQHLASL